MPFLVIGSLKAQGPGTSPANMISPTAAVLVKQIVVKESLPNYDSLLATLDASFFIGYDTVYMPVEYDANGTPTAFDNVVVQVKKEPYFPMIYDTSEVLTALITLPKLDSVDIYKIHFRLGDRSDQGFSLMNKVLETDAPGTGKIEFAQTDDYSLVIINLGETFVDKDYYRGEIILENARGDLSPLFSFSSDQLIGGQ